MRTRSHMYVRARAPYRANIHAMYRQNAAHGHGNPDRAWEEPSCSSTRPAEIEAWMQKPLRLGTQCKGRAPFHAPVDVVASGGGQGVGSAAPRPAPLRTRASPSQAVCPLFPPSPLNHARGRSREAFRKRRACRTRPHMYVRAAGALSCEARVWRHRGARARDACVPLSVGVTEPTPPRGATPMSRSRLMPPGHRTARGGHTPERDVGPAGLPRSALQSRPMRG